jgi:hypothetical protein
MTVPKGKRAISQMEFYANALKLRTDISAWLLRDFGIKPKVRSLDAVSKARAMSDEDKTALVDLLEKYSLGDQLTEDFPAWWVNERRRTIDAHLANIMACIVEANSIFPVHECEYFERRRLQTKAIGYLFALIEELQFVISVLWRTTGVDVEKYMPFVEACDRELALLRGWRQSDNKILQRVRKKPKEKEL